MNRRLLFKAETSEEDDLYIHPQLIPEVCLWDSSASKQVLVSYPQYNLNTYPKSRYTPIGLVVIPGWATEEIFGIYHDQTVLLGDRSSHAGRAVMMSLGYVNGSGIITNTPSTTSMVGVSTMSDNVDYYSENIANPAGYYGYQDLPWPDVSGTINVSTAGYSAFGSGNHFIACDNPKYDLHLTRQDMIAYRYQPDMYCATYVAEPGWDNQYCNKSLPPTPYIYDSITDSYSVNERYHCVFPPDTVFDNINYTSSGIIKKFSYTDMNCLGDFSGPYHTQIMKQETVTSGNQIYAIKNFKTAGTNAGDWYIPAFGELAYLSANYRKYNAALKHISNTYGGAVHLISDKPALTGEVENEDGTTTPTSTYYFTTSSTPLYSAWDWHGTTANYFSSLLPHIGLKYPGNGGVISGNFINSKNSQFLRAFCVCTA